MDRRTSDGEFSQPPTAKELHHMIGDLIHSTRTMKDDIRNEMKNTNDVLTGLAANFSTFIERSTEQSALLTKQIECLAAEKDARIRLENKIERLEANNKSEHEVLEHNGSSRYDKIDNRLRPVEEDVNTLKAFMEIQKSKIISSLPTVISVIAVCVAAYASVKGD